MTEQRVWRGQLVAPRQLLGQGLLLLGPGVAWLLVFLVLPSLVLILLSLASRGAYGEILWQPTLENLWRLLGYGILGWSADHFRILFRSVALAAVTTLFCLLLAYPLAFFVAGRGERGRLLWLTLLMIPMCTNSVIRAYGWMLLLSPGLPPAALASWLGFLPPGAALYPGYLAMLLGMVSLGLPLAFLPLYTNVERLDWSLLEAAEDLYASRWGILRHGILPQTMAGLLAAITLTFVPTMGMFVVPDLLGGARYWLVGNMVQQQFGASRDYPFGAAVSLVLVFLSLLGLWWMRRLGPAGQGEEEGE